MDQFRKLFVCLKRRILLLKTYAGSLFHPEGPVPEADEYQKDLFERIRAGDIVAALLPYDPISLERISKGGDSICKPCLVLKKDSDRLYVCIIDQKRRGSPVSSCHYRLSGLRYRIFTGKDPSSCCDGDILLKRVLKLHPGHLIGFICALKEDDLKQIARRLQMNDGEKAATSGIGYDAEKGDIISNEDGFWYVNRVSGEELICYRLSGKILYAGKAVWIEGVPYSADVSKEYLIRKDRSGLICISGDAVKHAVGQEEKRFRRRLREGKDAEDFPG